MHPKTKQKNHGKVKLTNPTRLCFLGSAINGNKNTNKKNDENKIKNPNPNPIKEKREKIFFVCLASFNINSFQRHTCTEDLGWELGLATKYSDSKGNDKEIRYENI